MSYIKSDHIFSAEEIGRYLGYHRHTVEAMLEKGELKGQTVQDILDFVTVQAVKKERERVIAFLNT